MSGFSTCVVSFFFSPSDVAMSGDGGGVALGTDGFGSFSCFSLSGDITSGDGDSLGTEGFCFTGGLSFKVAASGGFSSGGWFVSTSGST